MASLYALVLSYSCLKKLRSWRNCIIFSGKHSHPSGKKNKRKMERWKEPFRKYLMMHIKTWIFGTDTSNYSSFYYLISKPFFICPLVFTLSDDQTNIGRLFPCPRSTASRIEVTPIIPYASSHTSLWLVRNGHRLDSHPARPIKTSSEEQCWIHSQIVEQSLSYFQLWSGAPELPFLDEKS